jgi:DNA replication initiation complex subunit (GINS family)
VQEETRQPDPTRRLLRVFGVTVTNYEERMGKLLERAAQPDQADFLALTAEAIDLTADLNQRLQEMYAHVTETQTSLLAQLKAALPSTGDAR